MKNRILIILFLLSLAGPTVLYVPLRNYLDHTNYENRQLAEFPKLSIANIETIPSEFEAYYNDHVPFKNYFVKLKTRLDLKLLGVSAVTMVTVGTDNWLFYTPEKDGEDALADYQRTNLYTSEQVDSLIGHIRKAQELIEGRGMRFFMFVAPNKDSVYGQYMPKDIRQFGEVSRMDTVFPRLEAEGLPVYWVKDAIDEWGDKYQLYYKYDTHWNLAGVFIGSQEIARALLGESAVTPMDQVAVQAGGVCSGDMARMLSMSDVYNDDTLYIVEDYLPEIQVEKLESNENDSFAVYESNSPNDRTLFVVGDSFSQSLNVYLPKLYRRTVFATFDVYGKELLDQYPADDLVYLTVERNQYKFENPDTVLESSFAERGTEEE